MPQPCPDSCNPRQPETGASLDSVTPRTALTILDRQQWEQAAAEHAERAASLTAAWRQAHASGHRHPVEDFLVEYYMIRPTRLARWHPGAGTALANAAELLAEDSYRRWYRTEPDSGDGAITVDAQAFLAARSRNVALIEQVLGATAAAPARFSCFGLHEWAMVYRQREHRHPLPLRLGQEGTDAVVESHTITCSHYDAYRFFTPAAQPLNTLHPTRQSACTAEQPGCLHANMDLYKYAARLGPLCPGDLMLDCLELAREIRWLDMQASPYDLAAMDPAVGPDPVGTDTTSSADASGGVGSRTPVRIETAAGKETYVRRQRALAARAQDLRTRLRGVIATARACGLTSVSP